MGVNRSDGSALPSWPPDESDAPSRVGYTIQRNLEALRLHRGIGEAEMWSMHILHERGPLTLAELAREMRKATDHAGVAVGNAISRGMARFDDEDGRYLLTDDGNALFAAADRLTRDATTEVGKAEVDLLLQWYFGSKVDVAASVEDSVDMPKSSYPAVPESRWGRSKAYIRALLKGFGDAVMTLDLGPVLRNDRERGK